MGDYSNYDLRDDDPYLQPNSTCLINLLGITDTTSLNQAESAITQATLAELSHNPVSANFNLPHLQEIHRRIFSEIYPFAGKLRQVDIMKGGKLFLSCALIEQEANKLFEQLKDENFLCDLSLEKFSQRIGFYLGQINKIHAFREGNGRTQRVFIDQLAKQSNYYIKWQAISGESMAKACREARTVDPSAISLQRLIRLNIVESE